MYVRVVYWDWLAHMTLSDPPPLGTVQCHYRDRVPTSTSRVFRAHPASSPHPLNWWHPDDPGGRDDEVPEWAHVAGLASQLGAAIAGRVVAVPTPRAADGNDFLREAKTQHRIT